MTSPYFQDAQVTLWHGDCVEVLATLPASSIDAVVCDPPYGLEFMGKEWDAPWANGFTAIGNGKPLPDRQLHVNPRCTTCGSYQRGANKCHCQSPTFNDSQAAAVGRKNVEFQLWCEQWATHCLRVLKPGGHMLAFGGTRTWHRLACAIEDAGFEIRDSIAWLYGSGFPKSLDVSKAIDKAAGAEREVIGPNTVHHGGGTNHVYAQDEWTKANFAQKTMLTAPATDAAKQWQGWGTALKPAFEPIVVARKPLTGTVANNVLAHGTGALNIDGCRVGTSGGGNACPGGDDCQCADKNEIYSATKHPVRREGDFGRWPANVVLDDSQATELDKQSGITKGQIGMKADTPLQFGVGHRRTEQSFTRGIADEGGASRFFPTIRYTPKAPGIERPTADGVAHPTVKPLDLMRWLCRLVTPPGGTVLDPFAGSGTTGEAAIHEHMHAVLIEREPTYLPLIVARLSKPMAVGFDFEAPA